MAEPYPNIVNSGLSRRITIDGIDLDVQIYRLEDDPAWSLEVVNHEGTSIVFDDTFDTDQDAFSAFQSVVEEEGAATFLDRDNIIEFPGRR